MMWATQSGDRSVIRLLSTDYKPLFALLETFESVTRGTCNALDASCRCTLHMRVGVAENITCLAAARREEHGLN